MKGRRCGFDSSRSHAEGRLLETEDRAGERAVLFVLTTPLLPSSSPAYTRSLTPGKKRKSSTATTNLRSATLLSVYQVQYVRPVNLKMKSTERSTEKKMADEDAVLSRTRSLFAGSRHLWGRDCFPRSFRGGDAGNESFFVSCVAGIGPQETQDARKRNGEDLHLFCSMAFAFRLRY